jgi:CDP-paratose 2-epimerase
MKALITGSGGLIGSACARACSERGWSVTGVDNDTRARLFGPAASTAAVVESLTQDLPGYDHHVLDIRDRDAMRALIRSVRPALIIHAAAQPSHDKAAEIPHDDFEINAVGTLNLLTAARDFVPDSPFCFVSTNKVYGNRPNDLPLVETPSRWDYRDTPDGVDEMMGVDQCLHSLFGVSKLSADLLCQEFGRYFGMPIGIFRGGCLTGPHHAAVELHGFLNYIVKCAVRRLPYVVHGYKGKQVRDQIHATDVADLFLAFHAAPRAGEVYNLGGGRGNSLSILEAIAFLKEAGHDLDYAYRDTPRLGDHICYISDMTKLRRHFPAWQPRVGLPQILEELVAHHERAS